MAREADIHGLLTQRFTIGTNTTIGITIVPGQIAVAIKLLSGGTLEISGSTVAGGSQVAYPMSSNEVVNLDMPGKFWLAASGATCVAAMIRGKSAGT